MHTIMHILMHIMNNSVAILAQGSFGSCGGGPGGVVHAGCWCNQDGSRVITWPSRAGTLRHLPHHGLPALVARLDGGGPHQDGVRAAVHRDRGPHHRADFAVRRGTRPYAYHAYYCYY